MPKSSIARRTPSARSSLSRLIASSVSVIITDSVISSVRASGSSSASASAVATSLTMSEWNSCLTDRLMPIDGSVGAVICSRRSLRLPAALAQHPAPDVDDQPALLGERDELDRRDQPALGMAPAQQRLDAGDGLVLEPDERLVMKLELLALERPLQVGAQLEAGHHPVVHGGLEQAVAALALGLGDVHRGVGVADQLVGVGGVPRLDDRDAEAGADDQVVVVELERAAERVEDPLGGLDRRLRVVDVLEQDRELVAAEAGGGVGGADARGDALGHLEQDPVAGGVAEAVVDGLEVVEVDEQHGHPDAVAQRPRDRVADALVEQRAVGEVGDRIVERLVGELLLERLALGDVAAVEHDPADRAVAEQVGVQDLEVAQAAVLVREQAVDHLGAPVAPAPSVRRRSRRPCSSGCSSCSNGRPVTSSTV